MRETFLFKPLDSKLPYFVFDFDNGVLKRIVVSGKWSAFAIRFIDFIKPMLRINVYTIDILCPLPNEIVDFILGNIQSIIASNDYDVVHFFT